MSSFLGHGDYNFEKETSEMFEYYYYKIQVGKKTKWTTKKKNGFITILSKKKPGLRKCSPPESCHHNYQPLFEYFSQRYRRYKQIQIYKVTNKRCFQLPKGTQRLADIDSTRIVQ